MNKQTLSDLIAKKMTKQTLSDLIDELDTFYKNLAIPIIITADKPETQSLPIIYSNPALSKLITLDKQPTLVQVLEKLSEGYRVVPDVDYLHSIFSDKGPERTRIELYGSGKDCCYDWLISKLELNNQEYSIHQIIDHSNEFNEAIKDDLTGLYERNQFMALADRELNRVKRTESPLTFSMLDIDNFKNVNDTYGHAAGDEVLKNLADLLNQTLRGMDLICRYGGEEVLLALPDTNKEQASIVAERLRDIIETTPTIIKRENEQDYPINVTISLGVYTTPSNETHSLPEIIKFTDKALYNAKESGRNRVCVYNH